MLQKPKKSVQNRTKDQFRKIGDFNIPKPQISKITKIRKIFQNLDPTFLFWHSIFPTLDPTFLFWPVFKFPKKKLYF
jgi:hypothetical protein